MTGRDEREALAPGTAARGPGLTHVGADGRLRMVDVGDKPVTSRHAAASGNIRMRSDTLALVADNAVAKGDVLATARIAGVMAAKRTAELIPLCHSLALDDVQVAITLDDSLPGVRVGVQVRTQGRTGAEMEALTAATVTLLTIYDMVKGVDREMVIGDIVLDRKSGGMSGEYSRLDGTAPAR